MPWGDNPMCTLGWVAWCTLAWLPIRWAPAGGCSYSLRACHGPPAPISARAPSILTCIPEAAKHAGSRQSRSRLALARAADALPPRSLQYAPAEMQHIAVHAEHGHVYGYPSAVSHHYTVFSPAAAMAASSSSRSWMGPTHADNGAGTHCAHRLQSRSACSKPFPYLSLPTPTSPRGAAVPVTDGLETSFSSASLCEDGGAGPRGWEKLYVSNVPPHVQDHEVHQLFSPYGSVLEMQVMRRSDGSGKGNVFVSFRHPHEGQAAAAALNGLILGGSSNPLSVRPSTRKSGPTSRRSSTGSDKRGASPVSMHAGAFGHVHTRDGNQSGCAHPSGAIAPSG